MPTVPVAADRPCATTGSVLGPLRVVAEGQPKPDSGITAAAVDVALVKIAAILKLTDELSEDAPWMLAYLQQALVGAVISKENQEVISTLGGTSGILSAAGLRLTPWMSLVTASRECRRSAPTRAADPRHPGDALHDSQDETASSAALCHVDPPTAGPPGFTVCRLYAVPVAGAGTGWVIDGTGLAYYRRSQVTFELGTRARDWTSNVRTARAETRGKCGVLQTKAVTKVTLT